MAQGHHPAATAASASCGLPQYGQASPSSSPPLLALPAPENQQALQQAEAQSVTSQGSKPLLERKNCRSLELELDAAVEKGGEAYKSPGVQKNLQNQRSLANVSPSPKESLRTQCEAREKPHEGIDLQQPVDPLGSQQADPGAGKPGVQKHSTVPVKESMQRLKDAVALRDQEKKAKQGKGSDPKKHPQKKPSASPLVLKKPSSSSSSLKRPASVKKHVQSKDKKGEQHGKITKQQAKKLKPYGCSTCRAVEGCTRSCWVKRGYYPDW